MSLFDSLTNKAEELAGKVGIPPDQVLSIASSIEAKTGNGSSQIEAIEAAAAEHGLPVDTIKALVGHAGGSSDIAGEISGALGGFLKG
jgi:hypothetical protein